VPPASDRARIGVVGTGWWATYAHLPSLTSYRRAEVVALADPSPERLSLAGEHFGIAAQYADYHAMLDRGDLDGVVVATPHTTHYAVAREVLTRGIPLMLEKPMVLRARDARELVDLADQHGVCPQRKSSQLNRRLQTLLQEVSLGSCPQPQSECQRGGRVWQ